MFQSTHLREVRPTPLVNSDPHNSFNPRTCERCDLLLNSNKELQMMFQSTHLREVRPQCAPCNNHLSGFQSTHLREVRRLNCYVLPITTRFNPRTCERCDIGVEEVLIFNSVSIHAPARGATSARKRYNGTDGFQSTHLREVRQLRIHHALLIN